MGPERRQELRRYGAPAAFLAAVTIAVLLVKGALGGGGPGATTAAFATRPASTATTPTAPAQPTTSTAPAAAYYTVRPGDTLGAIALLERTTVAELLRLNPGIDPRALHTGQRIRVG